QHQRIVVPPTSTMKENPLQYRVRGTPVPTTRTRGTNYPKSTPFASVVRPAMLINTDDLDPVEVVLVVVDQVLDSG
ncbi:hypothetical protein ACL1CJ_13710, partial [Corynebacterium striatum]